MYNKVKESEQFVKLFVSVVYEQLVLIRRRSVTVVLSDLCVCHDVLVVY